MCEARCSSNADPTVEADIRLARASLVLDLAVAEARLATAWQQYEARRRKLDWIERGCRLFDLLGLTCPRGLLEASETADARCWRAERQLFLRSRAFEVASWELCTAAQADSAPTITAWIGLPFDVLAQLVEDALAPEAAGGLAA